MDKQFRNAIRSTTSDTIGHDRDGEPRNDWRWQLSHRLMSEADLERVLDLTDDERQACRSPRFAFAVTPYYASLMSRDDPNCPVRRQGVPTTAELNTTDNELEDPLAEEAHLVAPGLTHRYPDRALLYVTHLCPTYCRHCNRRRKVSTAGSAPSKSELEPALAYLRATPAVRDVLISGGDPLFLPDAWLNSLLVDLRSIEHIDCIRIATRCPVTLPQRITPELCDVLRQHHPIFVNTHFNHPKECTPEAAQALNRLADAGCVLGNQMVLLRGINDDVDTVRQLNRWLLRQRCRPYYIFQLDMAQGISHFRTPLRTGIDLIDGLRGHLSGVGVPHFVVDLPGGGGKVSLQPEYRVRRDGNKVVFRNYAGAEFEYDDQIG